MYTLAMYLYKFAILLASLFNKKARLKVRGHRYINHILRRDIKPGERYVWFHAASLGEFEQGRPLMERLRREHPEYRILLTFFSPSGYEVRHDYRGADVVCYLPYDTPGSVRKFLRLARPCMAFFIKYEFWSNMLRECHRRRIPVYSVSSIFRKDQIFFRKYGRSYAKVLTYITHFFVQNDESRQLLASLGLNNVTVVGDTRFDRVTDICREARQLPPVYHFKGNDRVLVAGSSWAPDEDLIINYFNRHPELKLIIAPHVIDEGHLKEIEGKLQRPALRYSAVQGAGVKQADCLIIDCYGLLSSIYRYGEVAYVGGGFGAGIHNVPEAAVYGIPVLFGPNNKHFQEAQHLLQCGACFEVTDQQSFDAVMDRLLTDEAYLQQCGQAAGEYISSNAGAADAVFSAIKFD